LPDGNAPDRVVKEIRTRELRVKELEEELARLQVSQPTRLHVARIRDLALMRASDLRSTLNADIPGAREALRQLFAGPITFSLEGTEYQLKGGTRVGALFEADSRSVTRIRLASSRGFEPRLLAKKRRKAAP
jgi:hypothetical protein